MISNGLLQEFSQLLLKHGAALEDLFCMVYTKEELNPITGKYKKYFDLTTVKRNSDKIPEGYSYKIRYKLDLSGNKIPQGKATYTTKTALIDEAVKLGFENRIEVLKNYELSKDKPKSGKAFYKMLNDYYQEGSKYLLDDNANNKREVVYNARVKAQTFIKDDLIPYLTEKNINHITEVTTPVYNGLKIYLQKKGIKDKTVNNRISFFIRILEHHLRNGLLPKLPYTKGTALLRLDGKQEKDDAELLPIEKLKGIYPNKKLIDPISLIQFINPLSKTKDFSKLDKKTKNIIFNDYIQPLTLGIIGLNTGMRNSEVARIKREDFIGVPKRNTFLLRAWNNKTDYFNKTSESKYRKIPLHSYTIEAVKFYIRRKEELHGKIEDTDFIFGRAVTNKDTNEIDGYLPAKIFDKAVLLLLKFIKHKDNFSDFFSSVDELLKLQEYKALQEELKEMKEAGKGITYYSFRKTFRTMFGIKRGSDLAEYFLGHKLGENSKVTYIQINSMDNNLFVDEYAEPVIAMLDKYVFYSDDELKKMADKKIKKNIDSLDYFQKNIEQGVPLKKVFMDYEVYEYREVKKKDGLHPNRYTQLSNI